LAAGYDVVVIGAGVNGLVASALLAKARLSTLVLERHAAPGGAAVTADIAPGFRAPILSHALGPLHPAVVKALRLDRAGLRVISPEPVLTTLGAQGATIVFHRDPVLTAASVNRLSPADAGRWVEFVRTMERLAGVVALVQRQAPPPLDQSVARNWWQLLSFVRQARSLSRRDQMQLARWLPMPVADLTSEWFENDLLQAALAAHAVFGTLAGPRSAGTAARLLQRMADDPEPVGSGTTVAGGPGAAAEAIATVARQAGATVRTGARVAQILTGGGRVAGVVLDDGEEIPASTVLSAVDPRQTFLSLMDSSALPPSFLQRMRNYRARGVMAKVNLALASAPVFPALAGDEVALRGRLLVAPGIDYLERAHDAAKYGELSGAPWLEIAVPTVNDPDLAPSGQHVMSVYVHFTPRRPRHDDGSPMDEAVYRAAMRALAPHAPGLDRLVLARQVVTPEDLETGWGLSGGHIFHGEPGLDQSWIARPLYGWARYATPIDGLYLGSAGTHPGGGLTGLPGWLAAQRVRDDLRKK
jgi:phytoene dehydrogenase-like protein